MNVTPINDRVLIKPTTEEEKLDGLVLPDTFRQDRPNSGTVLKTGSQVKSVKEGQGVYFNRYAGELIEIENKKLILIGIEDVYATFR